MASLSKRLRRAGKYAGAVYGFPYGAAYAGSRHASRERRDDSNKRKNKGLSGDPNIHLGRLAYLKAAGRPDDPAQRAWLHKRGLTDKDIDAMISGMSWVEASLAWRDWRMPAWANP